MAKERCLILAKRVWDGINKAGRPSKGGVIHAVFGNPSTRNGVVGEIPIEMRCTDDCLAQIQVSGIYDLETYNEQFNGSLTARGKSALLVKSLSMTDLLNGVVPGNNGTPIGAGAR